jgi:hypothetical protein
LFLNAVARWPVASRRVLATIGFSRFPLIVALPLFHCVLCKRR